MQLLQSQRALLLYTRMCKPYANAIIKNAVYAKMLECNYFAAQLKPVPRECNQLKNGSTSHPLAKSTFNTSSTSENHARRVNTFYWLIRQANLLTLCNNTRVHPSLYLPGKSLPVVPTSLGAQLSEQLSTGLAAIGVRGSHV